MLTYGRAIGEGKIIIISWYNKFHAVLCFIFLALGRFLPCKMLSAAVSVSPSCKCQREFNFYWQLMGFNRDYRRLWSIWPYSSTNAIFVTSDCTGDIDDDHLTSNQVLIYYLINSLHLLALTNNSFTHMS